MWKSNSVAARIVFVIVLISHLPLAVGGWQHPSEINMACYGVWLLINSLLVYSSLKQGFAGILLPLGYLLGNIAMLTLGFVVGGYTFNLGAAETMALYGVVGTISIWCVVGQLTKRWNPRILYIGAIAADLLSFYPQWKQYLLPHDYPTTGLLIGWMCWIVGAGMNLVFVEKLFFKLGMPEGQYRLLYEKEKRPLLIIEESAFSLENVCFMTATVFLMMR